MNCRHCGSPLDWEVIDLGYSPLANSYLPSIELQSEERLFPLRVMVCNGCFLVQTVDVTSPEEIFKSDYAYFSSTSRSWLEHATKFTEMAVSRFNIKPESRVIEIASNDGYLLRNFLAKGISCIGIEPTSSTAMAAVAQGIPVIVEFFTERLAERLNSNGILADMIICNNVYAHVQDINDFTRGLKALLKSNGVISMEFQYVLDLIDNSQFDTIYHEHFSYLSLTTVLHIFDRFGLRIWHVERLSTHGGSLRVYGCHSSDVRPPEESVQQLLDEEASKGVNRSEYYSKLQVEADRISTELKSHLSARFHQGIRTEAYGAAAKGVTLITYAKIDKELLPRIFDAAPSKQGKYIPGSSIPIRPLTELFDDPPDELLILPWNIAREIIYQLKPLRERGVKFLVAIPSVTYLPQ